MNLFTLFWVLFISPCLIIGFFSQIIKITIPFKTSLFFLLWIEKLFFFFLKGVFSLSYLSLSQFVSPCLCSLKNSECAFSKVCFWCGCEARCQLRRWEQEQGAVCGTTPSSAQPWGLQELWFNRTQRVLLPSLPPSL